MMIPAARANKLFGGDGGLMLTLFPAFPDDFDPATPLFVSIDGLDVPLYAERFERRGATGAWVHFADFDNERRATELLGRELRIKQTEAGKEAEEEDAFYMEDLIGFHAEAEGLSGEVTDYYDHDANPLLEVTTNEGEAVLIPAAEELIDRIDFEERTIRFTLPDGLLELNAKQP